MNKYINGNGFLTEDGKRIMAPVQQALNTALKELGANDEASLRNAGAVLAKLVGDTISNTIQNKKDTEAMLNAMSDEQFEAFMKAKYGERWLFQTATPEELKRSTAMMQPRLQAALSEMRDNFRVQYHGFNPRRK